MNINRRDLVAAAAGALSVSLVVAAGGVGDNFVNWISAKLEFRSETPQLYSIIPKRPHGIEPMVTIPVVEVVARAFLPSGTEPDEKYAFIGYLLFPNALSTNFIQRRAAAAAFLCLFTDAKRVEKSEIVPARMAVFFAPVTESADLTELRVSRDVETFLNVYDYFAAKRLAKDFQLDLTGVYLVGYVPPLEAPDVRRAELLQLDLSDKRPDQIEAALLALDTEFTLAAWRHAANAGRGVLSVMREVFDSLGGLVLGSAAVAAPTECR